MVVKIAIQSCSIAQHTVFTTADGLASDSITSIARDGSENIWFTDRARLTKTDHSVFSVYQLPSDLVSNYNTLLYCDGSNRTWVTRADRIGSFDGVAWNVTQAPSYIKAVIEFNGTIWIGTNSGIYQLVGSTWTSVGGALAGLSVRYFSKESSGRIIITTDYDAYRYDGSNLIHLNLPSTPNGGYIHGVTSEGADTWFNLSYSLYRCGINDTNAVLVNQNPVQIGQRLISSTGGLKIGGPGIIVFDDTVSVSVHDNNLKFPFPEINHRAATSDYIYAGGNGTGLVRIAIAGIRPHVQYLDKNQLEIPFQSCNVSGNTSVASSRAPKNYSATAFTAAIHWMIGKDSQGNLHCIAGTDVDKKEVYPGPIGNKTLNRYMKWDRVWKIEKEEIDSHIVNWNVPGYVAPRDIREWPGNGNTAEGEASMLAPFNDLDSDGIYEPQNGEYPIIKGDQAIFFICNDDSTHYLSSGAKFRLEMHVMAYVFDCSDSAYQYTFFQDVKFINRSNTDYNSVYVGNGNYMDIGSWGDEMITTDLKRDLIISYNASDFDDPMGAIGFLAHPPAMGITFLNRELSKSGNSITVSNTPFLPGMGVPQLPGEFENFLSGRWKDGSPLTYGGTGYGGNVQSDHIYTGDPVNSSGWNQQTPSGNLAITSSGPHNFYAGDTLELEVAYTFARDFNGNHLASVELLREYVDVIRAEYPYNACSGSLNIRNMRSNLQFEVYPNPASDRMIVKSEGIKELRIVSLEGKTLRSISPQVPETTVDLSDLPAGIYGICGENGDRIVSRTFVVMR